MSGAEHRANHEVKDDLLSAIDYCYEQGWAADGLPVVPPEQGRVEAMLATDPRDAQTVIAHHRATGNDCTLASAAVNAVMAGCLPEYFPVLVAALEAMNKPDFNFHGSTASTGGSSHIAIVSGPIVEAIGMNSAGNCIGQGNRANATIGRAIRLVIMNVFEMIPGISDQSTQGTPGKYSACIAERQDANPWEPLHRELGYDENTSSVTVYAGAGFVNCENHGGNTPEAVLGSIADAMGSLACISLGQSVVVLSPEHVGIIRAKGWSKADVKQFLFENAKQPLDELRRVAKYREVEHNKQGRPQFHRGLGPEDILVMVAGGLAGGHSTFISSWSRGRGSIMQSQPIGGH
ncbi:MAG: hypothetical protein K0U93_23700 [Gammaproteobacteria bacterium]|nr:hypothetical protein [Gammaproteobacteria bacterium]